MNFALPFFTSIVEACLGNSFIYDGRTFNCKNQYVKDIENGYR